MKNKTCQTSQEQIEDFNQVNQEFSPPPDKNNKNLIILLSISTLIFLPTFQPIPEANERISPVKIFSKNLFYNFFVTFFTLFLVLEIDVLGFLITGKGLYIF